MTQKEVELLRSMVLLLHKYDQFFGLLYPLPSEMVAYFDPNSPRPSLETLKSWEARMLEIDQKHGELALALEALRPHLGFGDQGRGTA
jgi:hypothetical protein